MKGKNDIDANSILEILLDVARQIKYAGGILNERYMHHLFTHLLQSKYESLHGVVEEEAPISLHPEWPTYKKATGLSYSRYRKADGKYYRNEGGKAGHIDFAIGDYRKPDVAVEFKLLYSQSNEDIGNIENIIFDFIKLLDGNNPFQVSTSLHCIFRESSLAESGRSSLKRKAEDALREAVRRLNVSNALCDGSRDLHLILTIVDELDNRQHWYHSKGTDGFVPGLPFGPS